VGTTIRIQHFGDADEAARRARIDKYRAADPEGLFRTYYDQLPPISTGPFRRWEARPPNTPLLHDAGSAMPAAEPRSPHIVCLLAARDCAHLLDGWFESVARFADAVVALDDGSVDETGALLRGHPLVARVLANPVRDGFADWDDGANRNLLLAAAAELAPSWIISIDADERVPLEDGVALRRFVRDEAQAGFGYGFRSYRMIGDEDHYDRVDYDAYRLFAFEPGHTFPTDRLHAPPIPTTIPREQWRLTSIRMKHLVALTESHRQARWEKYREADPDRVWEPDYRYTIESAGDVQPWPVRAHDLPYLPDWSAMDTAASALDLVGPALTLVMVVDTGVEREAVTALADFVAGEDDEQDEADNDDVEALAVTRDPYAADVLHAAGIDVLLVDATASTADLRNAAIGRARGDALTYVTPATMLGPADLAAILEAHDEGHALVGVRVHPAPTSAAGAADLRLRFAALSDDGEQLVDYISYARQALLRIGGFDRDVTDGFESIAARQIVALGLTATVLDTVPRQLRANGGVVALLRRQYERGRHLARAGAVLDIADPDLPAGTSAVEARLVAIGTAAARLGAARERRQQRRNGSA
jgi:hypothetical protein